MSWDTTNVFIAFIYGWQTSTVDRESLQVDRLRHILGLGLGQVRHIFWSGTNLTHGLQSSNTYFGWVWVWLGTSTTVWINCGVSFCYLYVQTPMADCIVCG